MRRFSRKTLFIFLLFLDTTFVFAADFESGIRNVVNATLTRIFPLLALYFAGEAFFMFAQGRPEAKDRLRAVGVGVVGLLTINAAWSWVSALVR